MFVAANRSSRSHLQSELVTTFTPSCEHTELEENGRGETKNKETVSQYLINKLLEKSSRRLLKRFSQIPANFSLSPRAGIATRAETERRSKRTNEWKGRKDERREREREREKEGRENRNIIQAYPSQLILSGRYLDFRCDRSIRELGVGHCRGSPTPAQPCSNLPRLLTTATRVLPPRRDT